MAWHEALVWIAGICGAFLTIIQLSDKLVTPFKSIKKDISELKETVKANQRHVMNDHEALKKQGEVNVRLLRANSLLMKHCSDQNHTGELAKEAAELDEFIYRESGTLN